MKINVQHIAKLASLPLTIDEEKKFEKQLSAVLEHIAKLSEVKTANTPETSQVTGLAYIDRPDETTPSLSQEEAIANVTHNGLFVVPVIIEEAIEQ